MKGKKKIKLIFFLLALLIVIREPPPILASQANSNAGISFTEKEDSKTSEEDTEKEEIDIENENFPSVINNGMISKLPQTGGQKKYIFLVVGLILVALSVRMTSRSKKRVTYYD